MLNHFDDTIKLRKITPTITDGFATQTVMAREVWADMQGATRQKSTAAAVKQQIKVIFVVNTIDFADEEELEYNGDIYDIVDTDCSSLDHVELTCERRRQRENI